MSAPPKPGPIQPRHKSLEVHGNFPGGNIVVDGIDGDRVLLHQDLLDFGPRELVLLKFRGQRGWGTVLTFSFTHPWKERKALSVIGLRGPALSLDGGITWKCLGSRAANGASFCYRFPATRQVVQFISGMPYTSDQFASFTWQYRISPYLEACSLAPRREGRRVERYHIGNLEGNPSYRAVLTARHHASEMMASYVLEGILSLLGEQVGENGFGKMPKRSSFLSSTRRASRTEIRARTDAGEITTATTAEPVFTPKLRHCALTCRSGPGGSHWSGWIYIIHTFEARVTRRSIRSGIGVRR